ncbi:MAG: hypothetical protein IPJ04_01600 [Candidatus Eisenbacteria bacterium]|nr:hypothetical protein [Candidatus Eisenbacteria bacterium]
MQAELRERAVQVLAAGKNGGGAEDELARVDERGVEVERDGGGLRRNAGACRGQTDHGQDAEQDAHE